MKHHCGPPWAICSVCQGRVHLQGCTTKREKRRDCCALRHAWLHALGRHVGLDDSALPMYDPQHPTWANT